MTNLPVVDWQVPSARATHKINGEELIDIAFSLDLAQVVNNSTRVQGDHVSILDLVFVTSSLTDADFTCDVVQGISAHKAVVVISHCSWWKSYKISTYRDFTCADDISVADELASNFDNFLGFVCSGDVEQAWDFFQNLVLFCLENCIPMRVKEHNTRYPWLTREIVTLKRKFNRLRKRPSLDDVCKADISIISNLLKVKLREAKTKYTNYT